MLEVRADQRPKDARCPYCHALVVEGERLWTCARCETVHHQDCARENGECTLLGCGQPVVVAATTEPLPRVDTSRREAASQLQDLLVLGVSLPTLTAVALAGAKAFQDRPTSEGIGWIPVTLTLAFITLVALGLRYVRRRDQGEDVPRQERRAPVVKPPADEPAERS